MSIRSLALPLTGLTLSLVTLNLPAQEAEKAAKPAAPKEDRTKNRGPETVELKFKLPPPPVLTPEEAVRALKVAKGFKVQLVASEPMIETPVSMSWDDQGRL